jgi:hypothetical protein
MSVVQMFPVLQSGFVSFMNPNLQQSIIEKNPYVDLVLNKPYLKSKNTFLFHPQVEEIYKEFMSSPVKMKDMAFRERIIKLAAKCFVDPDFGRWLMLQDHSKNIGGMHTKFLEDTIRYILTGSREYTHDAWIRMVHALPASSKLPGKTVKEVIMQFPLYEHLSSQVITNWVTHRGGYEDLLQSLFVIFGTRRQITDVANLTTY